MALSERERLRAFLKRQGVEMRPLPPDDPIYSQGPSLFFVKAEAAPPESSSEPPNKPQA
jgi:hypothetical protein